MFLFVLLLIHRLSSFCPRAPAGPQNSVVVVLFMVVTVVLVVVRSCFWSVQALGIRLIRAYGFGSRGLGYVLGLSIAHGFRKGLGS